VSGRDGAGAVAGAQPGGDRHRSDEGEREAGDDCEETLHFFTADAVTVIAKDTDWHPSGALAESLIGIVVPTDPLFGAVSCGLRVTVPEGTCRLDAGHVLGCGDVTETRYVVTRMSKLFGLE
jgi:hypothetical protein